MTIDKMTKKDFKEVEDREHWSENVECDSIIILPGNSKDIHDNRFRFMDFIAVKDNKPICKLSGCSDVIHIDGIGGYGFNWANKYKTVPVSVPPRSWSIDCLKKSGLLRLFCNSKMIAGAALSSFEIFAKDKLTIDNVDSM